MVLSYFLASEICKKDFSTKIFQEIFHHFDRCPALFNGISPLRNPHHLCQVALLILQKARCQLEQPERGQ